MFLPILLFSFVCPFINAHKEFTENATYGSAMQANLPPLERLEVESYTNTFAPNNSNAKEVILHVKENCYDLFDIFEKFPIICSLTIKGIRSFSNTTITNSAQSFPKNLTSLTLEHCRVTPDIFKKENNFEKLNLNLVSGLTDLQPFEKWAHLKSLEIVDCNITSVDFTRAAYNQSIKKIILDDNSIHSLNISEITHLQALIDFYALSAGIRDIIGWEKLSRKDRNRILIFGLIDNEYFDDACNQYNALNHSDFKYKFYVSGRTLRLGNNNETANDECEKQKKQKQKRMSYLEEIF